MSTKVVVTGLGATTPLGGDVASTWEGLLSGRSNAQVLTDERFAELPARIAAPVAVEPSEVLSRVEARKLDRYEQFALVAAREAWKDSGLADADVPGERIGVSVASGIGGLISLVNTYDVLQTKGPRHVTPYTIPMIMPNGGAAWVGLDIGARASVQTPVAACASGNEAIRHGIDLIRSGKADVAVVGGAEAAIHPLPMSAFGAMMALSRRNDEPRAGVPAVRQGTGRLPARRGRRGHGAGVGGARRRRGARIYAEVGGSGASADSHHIVQPDPKARATPPRCARRWPTPASAGRAQPHQRARHLDAGRRHRRGLGHPYRLRQGGREVVVTAPKGSLGHLLGAAGVAESIATVLSL